MAGGDIATAVSLRLSSGRTAFLKTLTGAPPHFFEREAAGLRWLGEATADGGVATPEVLAVDTDVLILAWVESGRPSTEAANVFGRALAATHRAGAAAFGAEEDGYIGRLPLLNRSLPTWAEFYAERRIAPYLKVLRDKAIVSAEDAAVVEAAVARGAEIVPEEPPARLHGDLWNGNVIWAGEDRAVVIDPAAYGGHREIDLAMLALFGLPQAAAGDERLRRGLPARRGLGGPARLPPACSRCSCTPVSSAASTAPARPGSPPATSETSSQVPAPRLSEPQILLPEERSGG
ncbi:fructosamine kinase family protein [Nocardioides convexus]|uniref:fructosamine kinase family protein n=1 Tax=Nocardioides convexus TaxID=2712224 RepID=UPI0024186C04|nr:fructosamine kinase family protein [Nocardioides convexus]